MRMRPHALRVKLAAPFVTHTLIPGTGPRVLLTFDDGPTEEVTAGVLERLAVVNARAVFFVIGEKVEKNQNLATLISAAGHAVGNHSHTHPSGPWPDYRRYTEDLRRCSEAVKVATGRNPRFFRAPEGRLHPGSIWGSRRMGMQHLLWSLDSNDWTCNNGAEARQAATRVLDEVRDGDIILLHEYASWTWDLLDVLIPGLTRRGFDLNSGLTDLS